MTSPAPSVEDGDETLPPSRPMVSYAQNAEDVVLANYFGERRRGFYIDIGANHPVDDSVTKHFYDLGWRGINVEPVAHLHELLQQHRPRDINLMVGVGAEPGTLRFDEDLDNAGLSSFHADLSANNAAAGHRIESREVPVVTLASICAEHVTTEIDFLKVDCEGFEADVLRGHDWDRFAPRVVLAENNFPEQWHDLVVSKGYHYVLNDGLNRYYLRADLAPKGTQWRPAVRAVDQYDPWIYVSQLHQLHRRIAELTTAETVPDIPPPARPMAMPATPAPAPMSPAGRVIRRVARSGPGRWLRRRLRI
jgi:FkbM family methyltransferase